MLSSSSWQGRHQSAEKSIITGRPAATLALTAAASYGRNESVRCAAWNMRAPMNTPAKSAMPPTTVAKLRNAPFCPELLSMKPSHRPPSVSPTGRTHTAQSGMSPTHR